ncbi:alpha/beta hydrolase [Streptomyces griseorubiginosus]|uniref:alpha/beta hydrolase n=1 Tax=Streptomyces griseorubiginosus TaxID=67304 RepID=UPI00363D3DF1
MRKTPMVWVAVMAAAGTLLSACSSPTPQRARASDTAAATSKATERGAAPTAHQSPRVSPNPPAAYTPAWPDRTLRTANGYLLNKCVPKELRSKATTLTTSDGLHLSALVLGDGPNGVLLNHEQGYSICSWLDTGQELAAKGFHVVLPEFRNHGASETDPENRDIGRDAAAALAELKRVGAQRVFLGGASCGGTTAITAGEEQKLPVTGLLIMSSPALCNPIDAVPSVRKITAPSLFIVGSGDMNGAVEKQVRTLYNNSGAKEKNLVIDDDGYHGTDMLRRGAHHAQIRKRVMTFIKDNARG